MLELSDKQKEVKGDIVKWYKKPVSEQQVYHLYGYAGTGKSTIVSDTIQELQETTKCKKVVTAAYTGKAASVLQKKGVPDAMTIHSLLYYPEKDEQGRLCGWIKREATDADMADLIVMDECSMIGNEIAQDIKALGRKILVIGDPGQLPPIKDDPGFHTNKPDAFLDEIHRQAADNPIIRLATMVRNGEKLPLNFAEQGCYIAPLNWETREAIFQPDTQVICGTHESRWNYTREIRRRRGIESQIPQAGEPIICCATNYARGLFNGFMGHAGEITVYNEDKTDEKGNTISRDEWFLDVYLDDIEDPKFKLRIDPYLFKNHYITSKEKLPRLLDNQKNYGMYSEFDWSYLITCHKAQGSSFKNVTIIDDSSAFRKDAGKWMYTALTRAEDGLVLLQKRWN